MRICLGCATEKGFYEEGTRKKKRALCILAFCLAAFGPTFLLYRILIFTPINLLKHCIKLGNCLKVKFLLEFNSSSRLDCIFAWQHRIAEHQWPWCRRTETEPRPGSQRFQPGKRS